MQLEHKNFRINLSDTVPNPSIHWGAEGGEEAKALIVLIVEYQPKNYQNLSMALLQSTCC